MKITPNKSRKGAALTLAASLLALPALTASTFNIAADFLADENGDGLSNGSLVVLVASLDPSTGVDNPTATSFAPGPDDIILDSFETFDWFGAVNEGSFTGTVVQNFNDPSLDKGGFSFDAGDPLTLFWYPDLKKVDFSDLESTGPGAGTAFGKFTSLDPVSGGAAWIAPDSNADTIDLTIKADEAGGDVVLNNPSKDNVTVFDLTADLRVGVIIPEPSVSLLLLGGLGLLGLHRRRHP